VVLGKPIISGAIINPVYAFFTEALALVAILMIINPAFLKKTWGLAIVGAGSALLGAALFPAVGTFTGIPACVLPGTKMPLALFGLPLAMCVSAVTVPAGYAAGNALAAAVEKLERKETGFAWAYACAAFMVCLWGLLILTR
jgi:hypothetical protein